MRRGYQIDHFIPQKLRPNLRADYDNLLYLCPSCNSLKGASLLPDPCIIALDSCLCFLRDGNVQALNSQGEIVIEVLNLDDSQLIDLRRRKIRILACLAANDRALFNREMGFPNDIPDLNNDPPPRNTRPDGIQSSWFAKRAAGALPQVY